MEIEDLIQALVFIGGLFSAWFGMKHQVKMLTEKLQKLERVLFTSSGMLNIVDFGTCREKRKNLDVQIKSGQDAIAELTKTISNMDKNIMLIMYRLDIDEHDSKNIRRYNKL